MKTHVEEQIKELEQKLKLKIIKKDKSFDSRINELISTHLQMPGFIELPGGDSVRASLRSSQEESVEKAPYKVIPDYIRHIEGEIKGRIEKLRRDLVETG